MSPSRPIVKEKPVLTTMNDSATQTTSSAGRPNSLLSVGSAMFVIELSTTPRNVPTQTTIAATQ